MTYTSVLLGSETPAQTRDDTIELITRGSVPLGTGFFLSYGRARISRIMNYLANKFVKSSRIRTTSSRNEAILSFITNTGIRNALAPLTIITSPSRPAPMPPSHPKFGCHTICVRNRVFVESASDAAIRTLSPRLARDLDRPKNCARRSIKS